MSPNPDHHKCDVPNMDYSDAERGRITCSPGKGGCGRTWAFRRGEGWVPDIKPLVPRRPLSFRRGGRRRVRS